MITGAAGFIGSQLAHKTWQDGEELVLVDNFSYGKKDNLLFQDHDFTNEVICADIRDKESISKLFVKGDIDYVYHIAGIAPLPDCQIDPCEAIDVNVKGTVNLLELARQYGVKKFIFASTNAIYENETRFPTKEKGFELPTLIYPNTKYAAERFCESFSKTYGMDITCLRFSNVYGPHVDCLRKQPPFVAYMIRELYYGRTPVFYSDGTQRRDYIYVDDLIRLAILVREHKGFDCVNVSSNQNYSVNEMYAIASRIMNKNISAEFATNIHYWENYPDLYTGHYPIKEEVLTHEVNKYTLCDNSYAKQEYGWTPQVDMEEGLKRMIEAECKLLDKLR